MATSVGVGHSFQKNPIDAGKEAARQALEQGGMTRPDFVFVFATVGYNQQLLVRSIREATSGAPLSGCSGEGIIARGVAAETNFGVSVMAIASDELRFQNLCVKEITSGSSGVSMAGERLAVGLQRLLAPDSIACFLFVDGLVFDFDPFHETFQKTLQYDRPLPFFGGLAADNWATRKTYQYHDDEVFSQGMSCVLMSGRGSITSGVNHGCVPVGTKRTITRCRGNIIYEIDGLPALDALKDYVEEGSESQWNKMTLNLCLGFKTPEHMRQAYGEFVVRYIMDKNDQEGSVTIQSDVKQGSELWILRRDKELIRDGLKLISRQIREKAGDGKPKFVMQFECMGRGKVVFREQEKLELLNMLQRDLGEGFPWIGFYTYGEIGPISSYNCIHNFTAVVAAVY
ncbi:FIST signal transduction protein [Geomonas sp.]|uniref:FIST signal transduction protein n=1 Tax=Geomonas sp. TaxID=2651584 RepID=UPI002B493E02|nr:FIST N-terminal domain-containing protein [Geomonas sp.]HJV36462.1 FIST N-terminal domain-containing protein [Geomonas sp.]